MKHSIRSLLGCILSAYLIACSNSSTSIRDTDGEDTSVDTPTPATEIEQSLAAIPQSLPVSNRFENTEVTEASGVQRSLSMSGAYYVHNDSGGSATLYVTDALGQSIGQIQLAGVQASDWEAVAGARLGGQPTIVVADVGNNDRNRSDLNLQVFAEPDFSDLALGFDITLDSQQVNVSYADGLNYDAEAVFIDGDNDTVVVVTKDGSDTAAQSIWKGSLASGLSDGSMVLEYRGLLAVPGGLLINAVTDIDIHPDGRQLAVLVYGATSSGKVFVWQPDIGEGTADALTRPADSEVSVPVIGSNRQAEGVSFSAQGDVLLVAAEASATSALTLIRY